ncbi:hypothetical protein [Arhodomonas sp. AD133]|uniref:tetratricopeptide repeat protein n=1 Tax=Arhodomonas sp. AD133 TaxID=3415009 RepID=UPI003EBE7817
MTSHAPIIAVLPPKAATLDERDSLIAQGLLEDVCAALTRFPELQVVSWASSADLAPLPDADVGARLGASHLLRSHADRAGDRLRVTAVLVDSATGRQLWNEALETPTDSVLDIRQELVARVAATLNARLEQSLLAAVYRKSPEALAAYEQVLRGLALLREGSPSADAAARECFRQALAQEPNYPRAYAGLSLSYFNEWSCQFWGQFRENGRLAYGYAHKALDLDDADAMLHVVVGRVHLYHRRFEQAAWYLDRALALCPNDAENLIQLSMCQVFLGHAETGKELAERAMRLNPYHPNYYYAYAAFPYLLTRDFEMALQVGARASGAPIVDVPAFTAIAYAFLGRMAEARDALESYHAAFRERITFGREPSPGEALQWLLEVNPFRQEDDVALIHEGFRLLGETNTTSPDRAGSDRCERARLARHGGGWTAAFAGRTALLPDLKGVHDIQRLLQSPGEDIHCLDLAGRGAELDTGAAILDERARHEIRSRIRALQEELADAEHQQDIGRAEQAREELDRLVEALSAALGLRGRTRRLGNLSERARTTVTWRIRHAVSRIQTVHYPLGRHLRNSIRTGTFCTYRPERPVQWHFSYNGVGQDIPARASSHY